MLVKQPYYIKTKMYIIYTFLGSIVEPCYIQNSVITNRVIKRLMCSRLGGSGTEAGSGWLMMIWVELVVVEYWYLGLREML